VRFLLRVDLDNTGSDATTTDQPRGAGRSAGGAGRSAATAAPPPADSEGNNIFLDRFVELPLGVLKRPVTRAVFLHACPVGAGGAVISAHVAAAAPTCADVTDPPPGHVHSGHPVKKCAIVSPQAAARRPLAGPRDHGGRRQWRGGGGRHRRARRRRRRGRGPRERRRGEHGGELPRGQPRGRAKSHRAPPPPPQIGRSRRRATRDGWRVESGGVDDSTRVEGDVVVPSRASSRRRQRGGVGGQWRAMVAALASRACADGWRLRGLRERTDASPLANVRCELSFL
jgi:hypothetical protein